MLNNVSPKQRAISAAIIRRPRERRGIHRPTELTDLHCLLTAARLMLVDAYQIRTDRAVRCRHIKSVIRPRRLAVGDQPSWLGDPASGKN